MDTQASESGLTENFKWCVENWKTLAGLLTFFATITGWYTDSTAKAEQITHTQKQVAAVATQYYPAVKKTLTQKTVRTTVIRSDCGKCDTLKSNFDAHLRRFH